MPVRALELKSGEALCFADVKTFLNRLYRECLIAYFFGACLFAGYSVQGFDCSVRGSDCFA